MGHGSAVVERALDAPAIDCVAASSPLHCTGPGEAELMDLSVVTTLYRSEGHVRDFYTRACAAASHLTSAFEIIFVNDGSPDESLDRALELHREDSRVRIIDLSRNFGHHKAVLTGLQHATGDLVFMLDSDLEEDPAWLQEFHRIMQATGADVVYGVQKRRKGAWFERVSGALAYTLYDLFLEQSIPRNVIATRLMTRRYVTQLVRHRDREVFLAGLWAITGFEQVPVIVDKRSREGHSYDNRRRISALVNALTSFSNRPLVYIFYMGCALIALSTVAAVFLVIQSLADGIGVPGYASLIVSVWFLGGLTIFCLGVIGIYLSKVFMETKDRPYTIIRAEYSRGGGESRFVDAQALPEGSQAISAQETPHSAAPRPVGR
jgi:putative glycosyltransferase